MLDNPRFDGHKDKVECTWSDDLGCFVAFTESHPETHYYGNTREAAMAKILHAEQPMAVEALRQHS